MAQKLQMEWVVLLQILTNHFEFKLPEMSSIYTAELTAIYKALNFAVERNEQTVNIISDSRSAIQAMEKYCDKNPIIQDIHSLIATNHTKTFYFCWVPSHVGVPGNELVDDLARQSAENGTVITSKIPQSDLKAFIKQQSIKNMKRLMA